MLNAPDQWRAANLALDQADVTVFGIFMLGENPPEQ